MRNGNIFTGLASPDGKAWTIIDLPVTLAMAGPVHFGLAVTAGNRDGSRLHTAAFDNVEFTGTPTGIALGRPDQESRRIMLRGFESAFLVPGRIGALKSVQVFSMQGSLLGEAQYDRAGGSRGNLDALPRPQGSFLLNFVGTGGTHLTKAPVR